MGAVKEIVFEDNQGPMGSVCLKDGTLVGYGSYGKELAANWKRTPEEFIDRYKDWSNGYVVSTLVEDEVHDDKGLSKEFRYQHLVDGTM